MTEFDFWHSHSGRREQVVAGCKLSSDSHMHAVVCKHLHTHTDMCTQAHTHTEACAHMHTDIGTHMHRDMCAHTHRHTGTQRCTHAQVEFPDRGRQAAKGLKRKTRNFPS